MTRKLWFCSLGLVLALAAAPAMAQYVATFDTDAEGFVAAFGNNQQGDFLVEGDGAGNLRITYGENEVYDPQVSAGGGLSIDADANPEFAVKFSASGLNQEYNCGVFTFSSAGHARNTFLYNNGDDQVKRINFATNTGDNIEDTINPGNFNGRTLTNFRMDFPEQNVGWADADAVILIDWVAWTNDPNFEPSGAEGEGEGEGEGEYPRNPVDAPMVGSAPVQDGAINAGEYGGATPVTVTTDNSWTVDWGGANPTVAASDCSFDIYTAWDSQALYVALDVTDQTVLISANAPGDFFGAAETVQIVLAAQNAVAREAGSLTDIEMVDGGGINWRNNAGGGDVDWGSANITGGWALTANGYILEVRYPWSDFKWTLPAIQAGSQIKALFAVVDKDVADAFNCFVLSSGGPEANPFENHKDLSAVNLVEPVAVQPLIYRFDCDTEGWAAVNNVTLGHTIGWLVYTPTGGDPHAWVAASIQGTALPEFGAVIEVQNAPDANPFQCAMYWFADGGHGRVPFNVQEGANVVRFNVPASQDAGTGAWDDSVNHIRLDLPEIDATPFINAGTTFLIDAIAVSEFDDFVPNPWTLDNDCDNDGLSNDYEAALGTDPNNSDTDADGVADGIEMEFGSDPLDPQDFVTVPVMNWLGLGLTALVLAAAALVLVTRRRTVRG